MFIDRKNPKYEVLSMSIINSMLKMLNTKDKNFIFNEIFITERKLQEKRCLVISGYLKNELDVVLTVVA